MTSELRPAVEVWIDAEEAYARSHKPDPKGGRYTFADPFAPAAVIQAYGDAREAKGREEQAREIERLREAVGILEDGLQEVGDDYPGSSCQEWCQHQIKQARAALAGDGHDQ